mmetsp:Transcript_71142/g.231039  ORF Transcript_71142/g.231039 Transcript_71142/m.231039 type:complete len:261 (-) Transcript_71142:7992-8774(-)
MGFAGVVEDLLENILLAGTDARRTGRCLLLEVQAGRLLEECHGPDHVADAQHPIQQHLGSRLHIPGRLQDEGHLVVVVDLVVGGVEQLGEHRHEVRLSKLDLSLHRLPVPAQIDAQLREQVIAHDIHARLLHQAHNFLVLVLQHPGQHVLVEALRACRRLDVEALLLDEIDGNCGKQGHLNVNDPLGQLVVDLLRGMVLLAQERVPPPAGCRGQSLLVPDGADLDDPRDHLRIEIRWRGEDDHPRVGHCDGDAVEIEQAP